MCFVCNMYLLLYLDGVWWGTRWAASLSNWRVFIFPVRKFGIIDLVCKKYINLLVAPSNPLKSQRLIIIKVQLGVLQRTLWSSKLTVSHFTYHCWVVTVEQYVRSYLLNLSHNWSNYWRARKGEVPKSRSKIKHHQPCFYFWILTPR